MTHSVAFFRAYPVSTNPAPLQLSFKNSHISVADTIPPPTAFMHTVDRGVLGRRIDLLFLCNYIYTTYRPRDYLVVLNANDLCRVSDSGSPIGWCL